MKTTSIPAEFDERREGYLQDDAPAGKAQTRSASAMNWVALNLTNAVVGEISPPPLSPYPFVFEPCSLGYIVQPLGDAEAAKIVANEADLLKDLCSNRRYLCLKAGGPDRPAAGPSK